MEIQPSMNVEILQYGRDQYEQAMPIASLDSAMEALSVSSKESFVAHLAYLEKAGFLVIHDIRNIIIKKDDVHATLGRSPGYQITGQGMSFIDNFHRPG